MFNNIQIFFSAMIAVFFLGLFLSAYKDRKSLIGLIALFIVSIVLINLPYWQLSCVGILMLLMLFFIKNISFEKLVACVMSGSVVGSYFAVMLFKELQIPFLMFILSAVLVIICAMCLLGILTQNIKKFFIYSGIVQFLFILIELCVSDILGTENNAAVQMLNYSIAGTLFFMTICLLNTNNAEQFKDMQGAYYKNHVIGVLAIISCLALAGLPGFNVFVGRWFLFTKAFKIDPVITVIEIFISLLLLLMYFKVVYVLIATYAAQKQKADMLPKVYAIILGILCLIFGLVPYLQFYIINKVIG